MANSLSIPRSAHIGTRVGAVLWGFKTKFFDGIRAVVFWMQVSQMISALSKLSDEQLDQIGIARSEIGPHANRLLSELRPHRNNM